MIPILTNEQIDKVWGERVFYPEHPRRDVIANALLKYTLGYPTKLVIRQICTDLNLTLSNGRLTTTGKKFLFEHFHNGLSV